MADLGFWGSLGNIIYSLIGDEAAKKGNLQQYNQGAELLGLPTWDVDGNMLSNYGDSKQLQNLLGILGQQTDYGNKVMGDMTVSGAKQYSHLMDSTRDRLGGLLGGYNDLQRGTDLRGGALEGRLGAGYDALGQGYGQRESDVMGLLAGMGNTERMDLNEYLSNTADANQAGLRARGLGSSTLTANTRTADNRAALRERGALEERLRTQQAGTLAGLRGDTLGANERGLAATTGLAADNLDRYTNIGMSGLGAQERGNAMLGAVQEAGTQNYLGNLGAQANFNLGQYGQQLGMTGQNYASQLGWLQNLQHQGPGVNNAINGAINYYGAMNAPQPQQGEWYDPIIGAGANTAGTLGTLWGAGALAGGGAGSALMAKGVTMMCIDSTSKIETPEGSRPLHDIEVGDMVYDGHMQPVTVTAVDCGMPHEERLNDYVNIETSRGTLICTGDHIVDGMAAKDHPDAVPCSPVRSGDLKLDGADTYIANGFVVTSMFSVYEDVE